MSAQVDSYANAIAHLPAGGTLILHDVSWEDYEELLADLGANAGVRVSYENGRLEIMSPSLAHEVYKDLILYMARLVAEEMDVVLESGGSTTFKDHRLAQGAEPDNCFYVQNAGRIIGKAHIDITVDPPPDIVVEVDVSHESTAKLSFYAGIGAPELWRYDERRFRIYRLSEGRYIEAEASSALPLITSNALTSFLEQCKTEGQSKTLQSFREWLSLTTHQ